MAVFDRPMEVEPELPVPAPVEEGKQEAAAPVWGPGKRILFRFAFSYFVLYLLGELLGLLDFIPYGGVFAEGYQRLWTRLVPWVAKQLFHAEAPLQVTGSGDTMFGWVQVLCFLVLALGRRWSGRCSIASAPTTHACMSGSGSTSASGWALR